jgi:hypothetical protein
MKTPRSTVPSSSACKATHRTNLEIYPQSSRELLDRQRSSVNVAFDHLEEGADIEDDYIEGPGKALEVVRSQLFIASIRLA